MRGLAEPAVDVTHSEQGLTSKTDGDMDQHDFELPKNDRRRSKRFSILAPAVGRIGNHKVRAFTRDVSTRGAYLSLGADKELPDVGEILDLVIKVPPTISSARPCFITGRGRIIRTEGGQWDQSGIGVEILDFAIQSKTNGGIRGGSDDTSPGFPDLDVA